MATLPPVFGREDEYSLLIRDRDKKNREDLSYQTDRFIFQMLNLLFSEKSGALPLCLYRTETEVEELLRRTRRREPSEIHRLDLMWAGLFQPTVGRIYREAAGAYLEVSTIQVTDPFELAKRVRKGQQIAGFLARSVSDDQYEVSCFNLVSDRKGVHAQSCGMHDNHLMARYAFDKVIGRTISYRRVDPSHPLDSYPKSCQDLMSWQILRRIFAGAGKIGTDGDNIELLGPARFQISERADFIGDLLSVSTGGNRPLINTRDEPHADPDRFGRLHFINGEGNRSPWSIILDIGVTQMVLSALEDEALHLPWIFENPIGALYKLSRDTTLQRPLTVRIRQNNLLQEKRPLELLQDFWIQLRQYLSWAHVPSWYYQLLEEAERITGFLLEGDPTGEAGRMLDWMIKRKFLTDFMEQKLGLNPEQKESWFHPSVCALDLSYHRLDDERAWVAAGEQYEVRDFETYFSPYGVPSDTSFWTDGRPVETRSYLMWLLATDPYWRKRLVIGDWEKLSLWNESPEDEVIVWLLDPRKFSKSHLDSVLGPNPDFSSVRERTRLMNFLKKEARVKPRSRLGALNRFGHPQSFSSG